jgi:hypothetical protein
MMTGSRIGWWVAAGLGLGLLAGPAMAQPVAVQSSCSARAGQCQTTCASRPPVFPYTSPYDRCSESCGPRWNQCLRDSTWVHLEDQYPGWRERVAPF